MFEDGLSRMTDGLEKRAAEANEASDSVYVLHGVGTAGEKRDAERRTQRALPTPGSFRWSALAAG
jgi:hypothetical protein